MTDETLSETLRAAANTMVRHCPDLRKCKLEPDCRERAETLTELADRLERLGPEIEHKVESYLGPSEEQWEALRWIAERTK